jgi:cell division protein FtsZ
MGGGTGTGAAPVVAKALSELANPPLIVGVILLPFGYEPKRLKMGKQVLVELSRYCKSVIPVYNDQLLRTFPKARTIDCLRIADDILLRAVASVTDLIERPGIVNVDMKDVKSVLGHNGQAIMGCGEASGEDRAEKALKMAVNSPLMADVSLSGAKAALVNITSDEDILLWETASLNEAVNKAVGESCNFIWGMAVDNSLKETGLMKVTVIATGLALDDSLKELEPIVLQPEDEPVIVLVPEQALTLAPAPPPQEPEPELELKQVVKRRIIKLGGGQALKGALGPKEDNSDSPSFMRNRQD